MGWPVHIVAVGGLVYNNSGEILVAKSVRKNTWSFLGGQVEVGENLEEALKREIYEESGVEVTVRKLVGIYSNVQQTIRHDEKTKQRKLHWILSAIMQTECREFRTRHRKLYG